MPETRDGYVRSRGPSNRTAVLSLLIAILAGIVLFGGFYLYGPREESTGTTTTPHAQPVIP
jgi:hypothetical protein